MSKQCLATGSSQFSTAICGIRGVSFGGAFGRIQLAMKVDFFYIESFLALSHNANVIRLEENDVKSW